MRKTEHDFLAWTSFPSSIKYINDEASWWVPPIIARIKVNPGETLKAEVNAKTENIASEPWDNWSLIAVYTVDQTGKLTYWRQLFIGQGTSNWRKYTELLPTPTIIPDGIFEVAFQCTSS